MCPTHEYSVREKDGTRRVYNKCFIVALQLSCERVYKCLSKDYTTFDNLDSWCRHTPGNKIENTDILENKVISCVSKSLFKKNNPDKKYLYPGLYIQKMYDMYGEECTANNKIPVKEEFYYKVFSSKFNLDFKPPSGDACKFYDDISINLSTEKNWKKY